MMFVNTYFNLKQSTVANVSVLGSLRKNLTECSDDELMEQMRELEKQIAKRKKKQKDFEM